LLAHLQQVAPSEASVLIIGETGTGKELVARHIHNLSARRNRPFVAVNCGAFSESLVEAELFGHEKGAFTGALSAKAGWFEEADGGTLFLDEIGDLPMAIQVKLLRVLQEREVVRLGSRKSIPIDVRVLAATNVQLEKAINAGHFREDLYYRLNVVSLELSPLRERPGDILPLTRHFIEAYSQRLGYGRITISHEAEQTAQLQLAGQYPRTGKRHPPHPADLPQRRDRARRPAPVEPAHRASGRSAVEHRRFTGSPAGTGLPKALRGTGRRPARKGRGRLAARRLSLQPLQPGAHRAARPEPQRHAHAPDQDRRTGGEQAAATENLHGERLIQLSI
jgi:hypothetical protein